jgi:DnaJ-class molecular chaperone
MADFERIDKARKTLGLKEEATLDEIKEKYRKLAIKYHPDKCKGKSKKKCEDKFKELTHANDVLMSYCGGYRYSFKKKDVQKNTMNQELYEHLSRFYSDDLSYRG